MFSQACVGNSRILSRGGLCPSMHHRSHDQGDLCLGVFTWGSLSGGVSFQGDLCPGGLCLGVSVWGGLCLGGICPGMSLSIGSLSRGVSVREIPWTETSPYGNELAVRILLGCILVGTVCSTSCSTAMLCTAVLK